MRWCVLALAAFLVGCQTPELASDKASGNPTPASDTGKGSQVPVPDVGDSGDTKIALRVWGREIKVGDTLDRVTDVFPDARKAVESSDLPPRFGSSYRARIWEKGDDGFGAILYGGRVCAAFASFEKADERRLNEALRAEEQAVGHSLTESVNASHTRYWFAEEGKQRLMICAYRDPNDGFKITVAIGDSGVMDALGASLKAATGDAARVEEFLGQKTPASNVGASR